MNKYLLYNDLTQIHNFLRNFIVILMSAFNPNYKYHKNISQF